VSGTGQLPRRRLGAHGPETGALGLGCMALSGIYGAVDDDASVRLVHEALDLGVTHLDTANSYGQGHNEELLGRALKHRRDDAVLATKFGIQEEGLGRPDAIRAALEASLRRLDTDRVDLYYMHRYDPTTPIEESMGALAALVAEGKVRYVGLSEVSPQRLRAAHAVHPITAVQQEYSPVSRDIEDGLLDTARELGVGLVAYSPLGRGLLSGTYRSGADLPADDSRRTRYPRYSEENLEHNLHLAGRIEDLARRHGLDAPTLVLAWVLSRGKDVVPIPGTRSSANLRRNVAAAHVDLDPGVAADLERLVPRGAARGDRYDSVMARRLDA
jgi:aryl-alcohol dehydrogenase-like predicted oxidoreductase